MFLGLVAALLHVQSLGCSLSDLQPSKRGAVQISESFIKQQCLLHHPGDGQNNTMTNNHSKLKVTINKEKF